MTTIEIYLEAKKELKAFREANEEVLGVYEAMLQAIVELEEELRQKAKKTRIDIEAGDIKFQFIPRYKKWIDFEKAMNCMETDEQRKKLMDITSQKIEVDIEKFLKLCRRGELPDKARIEAYQEEEIEPQVRLIENK